MIADAERNTLMSRYSKTSPSGRSQLRSDNLIRIDAAPHHGLRLLLALFALITGARLHAAEQVTRGPYLQMGTPTSMIVRWRTDPLTKGFVRYGTSLDHITNQATHNGILADHVVLLPKLKPATRYFYRIGSATNKWFNAPDPTYSFVTPPAAGPPRSVRFWALGDPGTGNTNQMAVREGFRNWSAEHPADLWLMLGDNAYATGTDKEYGKSVFEMYASEHRRMPLWPTLGNHDAFSANSATQSGVYYDVFTLPTLGQAGGLPSGTEAYYSFDYAHVHFICLDSHDTDRSATGAMATWLKADLASTARDWIICFFHHPPYSKGTHDSDKRTDSGGRLVEMRENIVPILEQGGVDLVLCGHSHDYERTFLLDGHYGSSTYLVPSMIRNHGDGRPDGDGAYEKPPGTGPHGGAVYLVTGSAGQTSGGKLNHPAMYLSLNKLGSVGVDIDAHELRVTFVGTKGQVRDYFTMRKK